MATLSFVLAAVNDARYMLLALLIAGVSWFEWASYKKLASFKGPSLAGFSNIWMTKAIASKQTHLKLYEASNKYGDLVRIGPNLLLTSDPDLVVHMNGARSRYTKAKWYAGQKVEADNDQSFSTIDEARHLKLKSQISIGYSGKEIDGLEETIGDHVLAFVKLIRRKYITVGSDIRPMDFARKSSFFTMDVITDIAFGHTWGCLDGDEDIGSWFVSMEEFLPIAIIASTLPFLRDFFNSKFISKLIMPKDTDETGPGKLLGIAKEVVRKRFEDDDPGKGRDIMGSFIRRGLNRQENVSEVTTQIVAGVDTTATVMRSTMLFLISNLPAYRALQGEIDSVNIKGVVITDEEARALPYLQAVIKEGSRMWPPATGLMPKVTPPEGDTFKGVFIPGGVDIGKNDWAIQRNKAIFGDDSDMFRPERWLETKGEQLEKMERTWGLVFGYGKYLCLGKNIAQLELNKVLFHLFREFDFVLVDPSNPWTSENYGLWIQKDMFVKVTERKRKP